MKKSYLIISVITLTSIFIASGKGSLEVDKINKKPIFLDKIKAKNPQAQNEINELKEDFYNEREKINQKYERKIKELKKNRRKEIKNLKDRYKNKMKRLRKKYPEIPDTDIDSKPKPKPRPPKLRDSEKAGGAPFPDHLYTPPSPSHKLKETRESPDIKEKKRIKKPKKDTLKDKEKSK